MDQGSWWQSQLKGRFPLDRCQWKMVDSASFTLGISAERCGAEAKARILRPNRKTDLDLCEGHLNEFDRIWGLKDHVVEAIR